jgi:hypothetical protein
MRRGLAVKSCALVPFLCFVTGAAAQEPQILKGTEPLALRGRIVTETDRSPVPGIRITFATGASALSDQEGRFAIRTLPAGSHQATLVTPACRTVTATIEVTREPAGELVVLLPDAMARMDLGPDFEAGEGTLVTGPEIESMRANTLTDVIRRIAPEMVEQGANQPGESTRLRGRNRATVGGRTEPVLVLDGLPQTTPAAILRDVRPTDVAAIQILSGAAGAWQFGSTGGLIRIWTKRGRGGGAVGLPANCPAYLGPVRDPDGTGSTMPPRRLSVDQGNRLPL